MLLKVVKMYSLMVESHEVQWYIAYMGYFISAIISFVVGFVTGYLFKGSHEWAAQSLEKYRKW